MAVSSHSAQISHQHTCINFLFSLGGKAEFKVLKTRECFSKDPEQRFGNMAVTPQALRLHRDILNSTVVFHFGPCASWLESSLEVTQSKKDGVQEKEL